MVLTTPTARHQAPPKPAASHQAPPTPQKRRLDRTEGVSLPRSADAVASIATVGRYPFLLQPGRSAQDFLGNKPSRRLHIAGVGTVRAPRVFAQLLQATSHFIGAWFGCYSGYVHRLPLPFRESKCLDAKRIQMNIQTQLVRPGRILYRYASKGALEESTLSIMANVEPRRETLVEPLDAAA